MNSISPLYENCVIKSKTKSPVNVNTMYNVLVGCADGQQKEPGRLSSSSFVLLTH